MHANVSPLRLSSLPLYRWLVVFAFLLAFVGGAAAVTVTGKLNSVDISEGESAIYEINVDGGRPEDTPVFPKVDGLLVSAPQQSSRVITDFSGSVQRTVQYLYAVSPQRPGKYEIPPIEVIVDGQRFTTPAATLRATAAPNTAPRDELAFGEISVVRQPAYVGEDVLVEMRYFLELGNTRWGQGGAQRPTLEGDGFSARPVPRAEQADVTIGNKRYTRVTFRAVVTPNRAGKLVLGPAVFEVGITKETNIGGPRSGFSLRMSNATPFPIAAPALNLEVKPLPVEGRPKDFSGAIGLFRFDGKGTPAHVKFGDPITMTLQVTGSGNFDRVGAPTLADPKGWRTYKPTEKFESAVQGVDTDGRKTFEIAVVPEGKQTAMPIFNFSYFDPEKGRYFTLTNPPAPLVIDGVVPTPVGPDPAAAKPKPAPDDILTIRPAPGFWGIGWQPRLSLWFALLVAPAPLIAFALFWRARRTDPQLAIRAALLREKSALLGRLRHATDRTELFDAVARILQIDLALVTGQPAGGIDEATILAHCDAPSVKKMYAARAELVYAGEIGGQATANERDQLLDTVAEFERNCR